MTTSSWAVSTLRETKGPSAYRGGFKGLKSSANASRRRTWEVKEENRSWREHPSKGPTEAPWWKGTLNKWAERRLVWLQARRKEQPPHDVLLRGEPGPYWTFRQTEVLPSS